MDIRAIQHILLLKPEQYSDVMISVFGEKLLSNLHTSQADLWLGDCTEFDEQEINKIQNIVDSYQSRKISLKVANSKLCSLTLEMDNLKTSVVNAIRRLMEKLPLCQPLEAITSETELWSAYADPVLDSLLSSPEEWIHLRWTNKKDTDDGVERPDGVISVLSQLRWGRNYGHGEVKIAEPTDNTYVLAWDLCRLAHFNRCLINYTSTKAAFAFQVKELAFDGLYTMCEITNIQIPKSVDYLDTMVTRRSLRRLLQVAHVFEKVTKQKQEVEEVFLSMKRSGPSLTQLEELISEKRDRKLPCTLRF
ncbi:hypothetical protein DFQ28_002442 [Apophysomyces sp. BC1034]|nr:hypothetical protein DFQ29_005668 [Apophysomyces sp. BC1021]KAG0181451.1 hypothetical protein DFQ28_002442 [Apophysomyces sp. BC1034]